MKPFETFEEFWSHNRVDIVTHLATALTAAASPGDVVQVVKDASAAAWMAGGCSLAGRIGIEFEAGDSKPRQPN